VTKISGGRNGVEEGFNRMMENKIAVKKSVYTMAKTAKHRDIELNSNL
jgi:hypothetical protein